MVKYKIMKIGLVCPYPLAHPGGVKEHVLALFGEFKKRGHQVKIITPASFRGETSPKDVIFIGTGKSFLYGATTVKMTFGLNYSPRIIKILNQEKFDLLHFHNPWISTLSWLLLFHSKAVNIATIHGIQEDLPLIQALFSPLVRPLVSSFWQKFAGRIAVSRAAYQFSRRYFPGPYKIIPNGVNLNRFSPAARPLKKFQDGKTCLLFVGRLEERKGIFYLLEALAKLQKKFPNLRLIIVGDGPQRKKVEKFIRQNLKRVILAGVVPSQKLPAYYASAQIFCAPAIFRESFGVVLLEAMATGLPIVAFANVGYKETLAGYDKRFLIPPKDTARFTHALELLIQDGNLRKKLCGWGLKKVQKFSWPKIAKKVLDYYREVYQKEGESKK